MLELNKIYQGDCIDVMKQMDENSVDAIITDPPYGLEFMGKEWDKFNAKISSTANDTGSFASQRGNVLPFGGGGNRVVFHKGIEASNSFQQFCFQWATQALRVLKPGGFLLSFGGTRTYHRMVSGIEDAGFEIRDTIMWLYGSGFPKSLNIGKQIDKMQGNERIWISESPFRASEEAERASAGKSQSGRTTHPDITKGNSEWEGWGTALKPACEPIVVARKPLSEKNVALNVLKWGTGGINIDGCRIGNDIIPAQKRGNADVVNFQSGGFTPEHQGRFPANLILDEEAAKMLDEQSGELISGGSGKLGTFRKAESPIEFTSSRFVTEKEFLEPNKGGASRFFYTAKSSKSERNEGLDNCDSDRRDLSREHGQAGTDNPFNRGAEIVKNIHPTVKPIDLMEYLIKLVTRENAIVLDPFAGSGSTLIACRKLTRNFIGIEKEHDYVKIAEARLKDYMEQKKLSEVLTI